MRAEMAVPNAPLVEWGEAPEFYVSGIGSLTETDGNVRVTLFAWVSPAGEPFAERRVRCHYIMAAAALDAATRKQQAFLAGVLTPLLAS